MPAQPSLPPPATLITADGAGDSFAVVRKSPSGEDCFSTETWANEHLEQFPFRLGPRRSALRSLPEDVSKFPVATWLKSVLGDGIQRLVLNSQLMRNPSPTGQPRRFRPDGSNLAWIVQDLRDAAPARFADWLRHLRTSLPELEDVRTVERPEDRHRYLIIRRAGVDVPSWMASDGTLRMLALTLLADVPGLTGTYLIEEPENGIHPGAMETVFQSLSSLYQAQVLMATHSPVILGVASVAQVLCFATDTNGATSIVSGAEHPALRDWKGEISLGTLFAGGVLG